jgi:hypothetical protein
MRILPTIDASSINDVTDCIFTDDGTLGSYTDFLIAEKMYCLQYFIGSSGTLKEVLVLPYEFQGHADHRPIVGDTPVRMDLVIETRYSGEPVHRYYSSSGGQWVLPSPMI